MPLVEFGFRPSSAQRLLTWSMNSSASSPERVHSRNFFPQRMRR
jgi:hypothetical protein